MPRILPRLIKALSDSSFALNHANETPTWTHRPSPKPRRNKRKSLYRAVPPRPSYDASKYERSILLEEGNPITNKNDYIGHKMRPPKVRVTGTLGKGKGKGKEKEKEQCKEGDGEAEDEQWEKVREMTDEERSWWSNPYLRMLASPLRKCIFTDRYLPSDFMIRLAPVKIPAHQRDDISTNPEQSKSKLPMDGPSRIIPVPDGLEHPRFKIRRSGSAAYITCWNDAIPQLFLRGRHKRMNPKLLPHPNLSQHIEHLLRVRILQEFCLLSERLRANPRDHTGTPMAIRRLTRSEWNFIKTTKSIPWEGAVAVIVVPPLNRDPTTGERPKPVMSPSVERIFAASSHPSTSLSPSSFSSHSSPSSPSISSLPSPSPPSHSLSSSSHASSSHSSHTPAPAIAGNSSTSRNSADRREAAEGGEEGHAKGERDATSKPPPPPMSILYPVCPSDSHPALTFTSKNEGEEERGISSPQAHVPLYNGISLFPNREQRAALYGYLTSALKAETRRRGQRGAGAVVGNGEGEGGKGEARKKVGGNDGDNTQEKGKGKDKASHGFLLVSNGETSKRADVAAVAISLWRLRMFNGAGWESENTDHWVGKESRKRPE